MSRRRSGDGFITFIEGVGAWLVATLLTIIAVWIGSSGAIADFEDVFPTIGGINALLIPLLAGLPFAVNFIIMLDDERIPMFFYVLEWIFCIASIAIGASMHFALGQPASAVWIGMPAIALLAGAVYRPLFARFASAGQMFGFIGLTAACIILVGVDFYFTLVRVDIMQWINIGIGVVGLALTIISLTRFGSPTEPYDSY